MDKKFTSQPCFQFSLRHATPLDNLREAYQSSEFPVLPLLSTPSSYVLIVTFSLDKVIPLFPEACPICNGEEGYDDGYGFMPCPRCYGELEGDYGESEWDLNGD
jgi:hypothetical protein